MRIGLLTEGGYPYTDGEGGLWCDRLVRGLAPHEFDLYALSRSASQEESGWVPLPPEIHRVRTAPLWCAESDGVTHGRRARRRLSDHYADLAAAVCSGAARGDEEALRLQKDRFRKGLYGLADLAREEGGLVAALRSEEAVRILERACRAPGALRAAHDARVPDLLAVAALIEGALRPLSLDWYAASDARGAHAGGAGWGGLGSVDLCHAASGGTAALPGLLARHFFGVPLLVTEHHVPLRTHYLAAAGHGSTASVRALGAAFHHLLTAEVYDRAALITPGSAHVRRWQERCGAGRHRLRTVHPGLDAGPFAAVGEGPAGDPRTLVWVGRIEPGKDLVTLLHAFAEIRRAEPGTRLRLVGRLAPGAEAAAYLAHCRELAHELCAGPGPADAGDAPVSFEEVGEADAGPADLAAAYASGAVVVLSSMVEGFPVSVVEAMLCGRATVSTDVGAVVEAVGGTGLVVPPKDPAALADACLALLRDPARRDRLGAAARSRALELFSVDQNVERFRALYLEIVSHYPVRRPHTDEDGTPVPFAHPAETRVRGSWAEAARPGGTGGTWDDLREAASPSATDPVTASGAELRRVPSWAVLDEAAAQRGSGVGGGVDVAGAGPVFGGARGESGEEFGAVTGPAFLRGRWRGGEFASSAPVGDAPGCGPVGLGESEGARRGGVVLRKRGGVVDSASPPGLGGAGGGWGQAAGTGGRWGGSGQDDGCGAERAPVGTGAVGLVPSRSVDESGDGHARPAEESASDALREAPALAAPRDGSGHAQDGTTASPLGPRSAAAIPLTESRGARCASPGLGNVLRAVFGKGLAPEHATATGSGDVSGPTALPDGLGTSHALPEDLGTASGPRSGDAESEISGSVAAFSVAVGPGVLGVGTAGSAATGAEDAAGAPGLTGDMAEWSGSAKVLPASRVPGGPGVGPARSGATGVEGAPGAPCPTCGKAGFSGAAPAFSAATGSGAQGAGTPRSGAAGVEGAPSAPRPTGDKGEVPEAGTMDVATTRMSFSAQEETQGPEGEPCSGGKAPAAVPGDLTASPGRTPPTGGPASEHTGAPAPASECSGTPASASPGGGCERGGDAMSSGTTDSADAASTAVRPPRNFREHTP